jgi:hypothetical protein
MVGGKTRLLGSGRNGEQETGESGLIPENYLVLAEDMLEQQDLPAEDVPASSAFAAKEAAIAEKRHSTEQISADNAARAAVAA